MEYADFALYGLAAGIIFGDVFFSTGHPSHGAFSPALLPFRWFYCPAHRRALFGWIGDRHGRKIVMVITIGLMGFSTMLIGLIPGYAQIGVWAPVCTGYSAIYSRAGAGAELSGGTVMLGEYAPVKRRGLVSSIIALGSNSGTLLASGLARCPWTKMRCSVGDGASSSAAFSSPRRRCSFVAISVKLRSLNDKSAAQGRT